MLSKFQVIFQKALARMTLVFLFTALIIALIGNVNRNDFNVSTWLGNTALAADTCPALSPGSQIKIVGAPAIYILDKAMHYRYYPDGDVFKTWHADEAYAPYYTKVSSGCLATLTPPDKGPFHAFFRPGSLVVKSAMADDLYVLLSKGVVAPVTPQMARAWYGDSSGNYTVMTIGLSEWPFYQKGTALSGNQPHDGMVIWYQNKYWYIDGTTMREVTAVGFSANQFKPNFVRQVNASAVAGLTQGAVIDAFVPELNDPTYGGGLMAPIINTPVTGPTPFITGNNYYVSLNGSNSGDGSLSSPWGSLPFALGRLSAGDTLSIRGGTYFLKNNGLRLAASGAPNAPITIQAYPGETTIIDGSSVPHGPEGTGSDTLRITGDYVTIQGIQFQNNAADGINIAGKNVRLLNNIVHHSQNGGIRVRYTAGTFPPAAVTIDGNKVYRSSLENALTTHAADASGLSDVQGNWWSAGIVVNNASGISISNNLVYENYGEGILCYLVVQCNMRGNTVYDNFSAGLYYDNVTNSTMEKNMVYSTGNTEFYRFNKPQDGIFIANEDYTKKGENLAADVNESNNNRILNNIVVGEGYDFAYGAYERGGGLKNTLVAHNTFYGADSTLLMIQPDAGHSNSSFVNNIFYQTNGKPILTDYGGERYQATPGISFHHNLWFGADRVTGAKGGGDIVGKDPLLQNPGSLAPDNYKLLSGSPARQAGAAVGVADDYFGTQRPTTNPDIGAHQQ